VHEVSAIAANPALASASALAGVAGVRAAGCAVTVANRVIVCRVGPGVGYDLRFRVIVGGQSSAPYERLNMSYEVETKKGLVVSRAATATATATAAAASRERGRRERAPSR